MSKWSNMHERVESYLYTRRSVGYILRIEGKQLKQVASFADKRGHQGHITIDLAIAWAANSQRSCQIGYARRLERVRNLAKYCALFEPKTEIPPPHLFGPTRRRLTPYIYSDQEILQLLEAADDLPSKLGLRPATIRCLLGLLAATGLRVSEALRLTRNDVDLSQGLLVVRHTKFRKTRYVPLHPTVCEALRDYASFRDQRLPLAQDTEFFLLDDGCALGYWQARYAFRCIQSLLGWDTCASSRRPRLYDLRHHAESRIMPISQQRPSLSCVFPAAYDHRRVFKVGIIQLCLELGNGAKQEKRHAGEVVRTPRFHRAFV